MTVRVLLADDHAVLREGIAALIDAEPDMTVVGQAADADSTVTLCRRLRPDVVVLDLSMPGGGLSVLPRIHEDETPARVLVLTMHDDPAYMRRVMEAGGAGYLVKAAASSELIDALREVASGQSFIRISLGEPRRLDTAQASSSALSPREREVLVLLARGLTNREAAERLGINKKTVDTYRTRLQDKLGLTTRAELFAYAERTGLLIGNG